MAKVVRFHEIGGPEVLRIDDVDVVGPGANEVRIAVKAIGLNRVESMFRSGSFYLPALPSKIGYEAAGIIESVGSDVNGFAVGDRVATLPGLSMEQYGTCGELILYPANMLVKISDEQPMSSAAATWMQYLTAYALIAVGDIKRGDTVVITAASSSVGLAAIQIANAAGAIPIAVTRGSEKANGLRMHGAAHVIVSDKQDVTKAILDITNGRGANIAFDALGGQPLTNLLNAMTPKGIVILYGALTGNEVTVSLQNVMLKGLTVRGFAANELFADVNLQKRAIDYINSGLVSEKLNPIIDRIFSLKNIVDAHRYLESNSQIGKIVVIVD